jgi:hypothetical protein
MKNFVFIYYSKGDTGDRPMEEVKKASMDWFGKLGDKLVDAGNPFNTGAQAVDKSGVMDVKDMPASGYSIIKASSMAEAVEIAKGCPMAGEDRGVVCVYETMPM